MALTAAAVPLWMHLSLMEECRGRVERALAAIESGAALDSQREMKLLAALGTSLVYTRGAVAEIGEVGIKALEIAESLGDAEYQLSLALEPVELLPIQQRSAPDRANA